MYRIRTIVAVLLFLTSLGVAKAAFASEDNSYTASKTENSPSSRSSQELNVLRYVATSLAGGREAMRTLHGAPYEDDNRDRLQPPIPGMNCGIDRILSFVSCYSAVVNNKKEAENMFNQLNDAVEAALPSTLWQPVEHIPAVRSTIRNISYAHVKSGAQIDIELTAEPALDIQSYVVSLYGWTGP
jgi:hypothetical protein